MYLWTKFTETGDGSYVPNSTVSLEILFEVQVGFGSMDINMDDVDAFLVELADGLDSYCIPDNCTVTTIMWVCVRFLLLVMV